MRFVKKTLTAKFYDCFSSFRSTGFIPRAQRVKIPHAEKQHLVKIKDAGSNKKIKWLTRVRISPQTGNRSM
jgi:hypothetical protein